MSNPPIRTAPTAPITPARVWLASLALAAVLPTLLWIAVDPVAGYALRAESGGTTMRVTLPFVLAGALIPGALGLGLAALARRFTWGRTAWLVLACLALVLSLGSPLGGTTAVTVIVLMSMHVAVGVPIIVGGLQLAARTRR